MKILILGIGNIIFGDEGIGPHLANLIEEKYVFMSDKHTVDIIDGGTLAQRLIPLITDYDRVILIDCVHIEGGEIGDVYSFDFDKMPEYITWQGSAHEVEMLQTLQMIDMMGDLPPVKIIGVIPYVIGENSTFALTQAVVDASVTMEYTIIEYIRSLGVKVELKNENLKITDVSEHTYLKGVGYDTGI